ncbi:sulfatase [Rugosimonospora africana]|uniref:Phosphoglycerol transferase MdoB n=1 Tax=Rugosimonospora africana TaxID=556532 RepID=A0A8J3QTD5_9ACTN|nr:sulfatase [Rugosimonospora africana]GIH15652.1 hypothetical protein Raf01_38240 [Rugosimonospora africana]
MRLVRRPAPEAGTAGEGQEKQRGRVRTVAGWVTTVLAFLLVWFALVAPEEISRLSFGAFVRIPIEGLVFVALILALPDRARRIVAPIAGVLLGLLALVKILDMVFFVALNRPFNPVIDRSYLGSAVSLLSDAVGRHDAVLFLIGAVVVCAAVLVFTPLSVTRLSRLLTRRRTGSTRVVAVLTVVWVLCAAFGARIVSGDPLASTSAAGAAYEQVRQVRSGLASQRDFAQAAAVDPYRNTPSGDLLTALRGKDVIVAFVESYGQVAVQDSSFSPQVDAVLDSGTASLAAAGFSSRSAWLTSPTFGGISWLAHSTLQSGLWIDNQQRYNDLVKTDRFTLSDAFKRAGWRTVGDVPSNEQDWPEGTSFYHYDTIYDSRNVGYRGPSFSYANMPDQYILSAFQRLELAKPDHAPVMAEIDLVSSHTPWAPLPHLVNWDQVGDGSVFDGMPQQGPSAALVWRDPNRVRAQYGESVQYSLNSLIGFVQNYHDDNLVLVMLGDHQPATIVSGQGASHRVPISIIAHDPAVMGDISGWGWQDGMKPGAGAPDWPMDAFRDRFLTAFGPSPSPATSPAPRH